MTPFDELNGALLEHPHHDVVAQVLRSQVRDVLRARDIPDLDHLVVDPLLHPQGRCVDVPDLALKGMAMARTLNHSCHRGLVAQPSTLQPQLQLPSSSPATANVCDQAMRLACGTRFMVPKLSPA